MASDNTPTFEAEPEESIEAALIARLTAVCTLPIEGALAAVAEGKVKAITGDTFISVAVDQQSQDLDFRGSRVPHSYRAAVVVHYAQADDANAAAFRDECRRVRSALCALTGDGCETLGADNFACDAFVIDSTSTTFEGGENPCNLKSYSATIKGRVKPTEA